MSGLSVQTPTEADSLVGKYVRFRFLPSEVKPTPIKVTAVTAEGMIRLEHWEEAEFAPQFFEIVDAPEMKKSA